MKKYQRGLVIGRFQPFHKGHVFLIQKALDVCDEVIIGIGSSNVTDQNNPFAFNMRKKMIDLFVKDQNLQVRIPKVIDIPDHPDDARWFEIVRTKVGDFDISFGDNDWVNGIFESNGIKVERIGFHNRTELEGWKIRQLMKDGRQWRDRVPIYIASFIDSL